MALTLNPNPDPSRNPNHGRGREFKGWRAAATTRYGERALTLHTPYL